MTPTLALLWRYEARRSGAAPLLLPALSATAIVLLAAWVQDSSGRLGDGGVRLTATVFPAAVGMAASAAMGRERLLELHATLPTAFSTTVARRLATVGAVTLLSATILVVNLEVKGLWPHPAHGLLGLLVPLSSATFLVGLAAWSTAVLRSAAAASTVVVGGWLFEIFLWDTYVALWEANRIVLVVVGGTLLLRGLHHLSDSERLVTGGRR